MVDQQKCISARIPAKSIEIDTLKDIVPNALIKIISAISEDYYFIYNLTEEDAVKLKLLGCRTFADMIEI